MCYRLGAKFRNFRRENLKMMWDDGTPEGVYSGFIHALGRDTTQTYHGHAFKMFNDAGEHVITLKMNSNRNLYFIPPKEDDYEIINGAEYKHAVKERTFMEDYRERTGQCAHALRPHFSFWSHRLPISFILFTRWAACSPCDHYMACCSCGPKA